MKKMLENFGSQLLSRSEMKNVFGAATATADCGGGRSVTCSGTNCASSDPNPIIGEKGGCSCYGPEGYEVKNCLGGIQ